MIEPLSLPNALQLKARRCIDRPRQILSWKWMQTQGRPLAQDTALVGKTSLVWPEKDPDALNYPQECAGEDKVDDNPLEVDRVLGLHLLPSQLQHAIQHLHMACFSQLAIHLPFLPFHIRILLTTSASSRVYVPYGCLALALALPPSLLPSSLPGLPPHLPSLPPLLVLRYPTENSGNQWHHECNSW